MAGEGRGAAGGEATGIIGGAAGGGGGVAGGGGGAGGGATGRIGGAAGAGGAAAVTFVCDNLEAAFYTIYTVQPFIQLSFVC